MMIKRLKDKIGKKNKTIKYHTTQNKEGNERRIKGVGNQNEISNKE